MPNYIERTLPLKGFHNYFISTYGYVFFVNQTKEYPCPRRKDKFARIQVEIDEKEYDLVYLMLEYFFPKCNPEDTVYFTHSRDFKVSVKSISFRKTRLGVPSDEDDDLTVLWKCAMKAGSANSRSGQRITGVDVLRVLKINNFKCLYCGDDLSPLTWHLDHFRPISRGGRNHFKNLAPACSTCNKMKDVLPGYEFIKQCKKILLRHRLGEDLVKISSSMEKELVESLNDDGFEIFNEKSP
jgi:hypothetical protein